VTRFLKLLGVVSALGLCFAGSAAGEVVTNTIVPIAATSFVPCADGGAGEYVALTGALHVKVSVTVDGAGGLHVTESYQPQNVTGTGLTTGTTYEATGMTNSVSNASGDGGFNNKFEDIFRIIGPGPGNNLLVHENFHLEVDSDGNVTLLDDTFTATCK